MSTGLDRWKTDLLGLPPRERAELAHFLLTTLGPDEPDVEAAWDAEASRRVAAIRSGEASGRSADDVLGELRGLYP